MASTRRNFIAKTALAAAAASVNSTLRAAQKSDIHIVQKGDTLSHIAVRYGVSVSQLKRANGLSSDLIRIGQKLHIPITKSSKDDLLQSIRQQNSRLRVRRDNWNTIVVHHSAIKYGNATIYDRSHRERGMRNGLAYHFVIGNGIDSGDGEIEMGPRWIKQLHGGHVRSYKVNQTAIGICLIGNFEVSHPSKLQIEAFIQLMDWLRADVLRKKVRFAGHKDIERNLCPGKNFPLAAMHARYS
ncbi:MAG: LysM peptidoglycan-binding domain-containing protein [Verrucomicrobiota bacterium]